MIIGKVIQLNYLYDYFFFLLGKFIVAELEKLHVRLANLSWLGNAIGRSEFEFAFPALL